MTENETKTAEQKKRDLYLRQKELLATLLEHGAISQAQYDNLQRKTVAKATAIEQQGFFTRFHEK